MVATIIAGLGLLMATGSALYNDIINKYGSVLRTALIKLAAELASKISKNNKLLDKLFTAYQNRNSQLLNEMMYGMGYGPRMQTLIKSLQKNEDEYNSQVEALKDANIALEKAVNEVNSSTANAGVNLTGNKLAEETVNKYINYVDDANLKQNIQAGMIQDNKTPEEKAEIAKEVLDKTLGRNFIT